MKTKFSQSATFERQGIQWLHSIFENTGISLRFKQKNIWVQWEREVCINEKSWSGRGMALQGSLKTLLVAVAG